MIVWVKNLFSLRIVEDIVLGIFVTIIASLVIAYISLLLHPSYNIGDIIVFGSYEQDNHLSNGGEDIEWYVLDRDGDSYLLLSKYILDAHCFHDKDVEISWEKCNVRKWLNDDFLNIAFSISDQKKIKTVMNENEDNIKYKTLGGNATKDKIFSFTYLMCSVWYNL